jgi:hypothetical protein
MAANLAVFVRRRVMSASTSEVHLAGTYLSQAAPESTAAQVVLRLPAEQVDFDVVATLGRTLEEEQLLEDELYVDIDDVDVLAQLHRFFELLIRGQDVHESVIWPQQFIWSATSMINVMHHREGQSKGKGTYMYGRCT